MKILAILLILTSLVKLTLLFSSNTSEFIFKCDELRIFSQEWLASVLYITIADGLVGLFCGAFILFIT